MVVEQVGQMAVYLVALFLYHQVKDEMVVLVVELVVHKLVVLLVLKVVLEHPIKDMLVVIHHDHQTKVDKVEVVEEKAVLGVMPQIIMEQTVELVQLMLIEQEVI